MSEQRNPSDEIIDIVSEMIGSRGTLTEMLGSSRDTVTMQRGVTLAQEGIPGGSEWDSEAAVLTRRLFDNHPELSDDEKLGTYIVTRAVGEWATFRALGGNSLRIEDEVNLENMTRLEDDQIGEVHRLIEQFG